jgi:adenylate kinase
MVVFGISGVGKTTACHRYVLHHPEVLHLKASELLRDALKVDPENLRTQSSAGIIKNQDRLAQALQDRLTESGLENFVLDAHSFIDNDGDLVSIPTATIASLKPTGLILLEATPEEIAARRLLSGDRKRPQRSIEELRSQIDLSRRNVQRYAVELKLPLKIATVGPGFDLDHAIASLTHRAQ